MSSPQTAEKWYHYATPIIITIIACAMAILTPVWAWDWYHQPFLGMLIEPSMVVSDIEKPTWPAVQAGVDWPDRIIQAEGQPVSNFKQLEIIVAERGGAPVQITFEQRDGQTYQVDITPGQAHLEELLTYFGIPYLVGLVFLASGLWAFWLGWRQLPARAFLMFCASASLSLTTFLDMDTSHHAALIWALSLPTTATATIHLALLFPRPSSLLKRFPWLTYLPWVIWAVVCLPIVRDMLLPANPWDYFASWRTAYIYIAVGMLAFISATLYRIYRSNSPMQRQQSRIIVFGAALSFTPLMLLYLVPVATTAKIEFNTALLMLPLGIFPTTVAYAIVRYRLLDVDRILSRAVAYGVLTIAVVAIFYLSSAGLSILLQQAVNPSNPILMAIYLLILVVALNPLRSLVTTAIDRAFYRTPTDYRVVLTTLSRELVISPDLMQTSSTLLRKLENALNPENLELYLWDDDRGIYHDFDAPEDERWFVPLESAIARLLNESTEPVWVSVNSPQRSRLVDPASTAMLEQARYIVFAPLRYEGRMIGFLGLGAKRSGDPYTGDDLEFLGAVAAQSSLAVENARLFSSLRRTLDETLEMKNLMDDIFASIVSGVITTDLEQKVTLFNQASERILGIRAEQVLGKKLPLTLPLGEPLDAITTMTIQQGATLLNQELEQQDSNRGQLFLRLSCTPLRDAQQSTKGAAIVIEDLTQQRHLEAERERIHMTFGRVVAPRVRDRLLADPSNLHMEGMRQELTVMFADLHGFTAFSEKAQPETLLAVLNSYLALGAGAVLNEEGTLDKFIGDAVMAFWNAPDRQIDHTLRAARAALNIMQAVAAHRDQLEAIQQLHFSIGITTGEAMVGNVGTDELFNYTAIGDTVNLAQRLEALAEPDQILLSEDAYRQIESYVVARPLPAMRVKGRQQEVNVWVLEALR